MMKLWRVLFVGIVVGTISTVEAQVDKNVFMQQIKAGVTTQPDYGQLLDDALEMLDVNHDRIVSENEIRQFAEGLEAIPNLTQNEKKMHKQKIFELFKHEDIDKNKQLDEKEVRQFMQRWTDVWTEFEAERKFRVMDRNNDGVFDDKDIPSVEESMALFENAVDKMRESAQQMKEINPEQLVNNMIEDMIRAQADEDFFQMDKNQDKCVTKKEFADYQFKAQDKWEDEDQYRLSYEDYLQMYDEEPKKKADCLTKDEYIADFIQSVREMNMED